MQAVVSAAGEGTRLHPLPERRPKGLVEVNDKPILTYVFETLLEAGVDELIVVSHLAEQIIDYFGDVYDGAQQVRLSA